MGGWVRYTILIQQSVQVFIKPAAAKRAPAQKIMFEAFWPLNSSGYVTATCSGPQRLSVLHSRAGVTHFIAVVTAKMCHSSCKHVSRWFQPDNIQRVQLVSRSLEGVQKVTERNWTLTAGCLNPNPNHIWEVELLLPKSDNNPKLLMELITATLHPRFWFLPLFNFKVKK